MRDGRVVGEKYKSLDKYLDFQGVSVLRRLSLLHRHRLFFSVWNKLFRTEMIKSEHLEFPEIPRLEDACFVYRYLLKTKKLCWENAPLYCYRVYKNGRVSATQSFILNEFSDCSLRTYAGGVA